MPLFSSFRPEIEELKKQDSPWAERLLSYCSKLGFTLYGAQLRELSKLMTKDAALVAAEVGSGKTLLASVYLNFHSPRDACSLVVAPKGVHPQWKEEIGRFSNRRVTIVDNLGSLATGINLVNVEAFRAGATFNREVTCVVADEAHFLANTSRQTIEFLKATLGVRRRIALTATPVPNRTSELFYLLGWLSHSTWVSGDTSGSFPYSFHDVDRFNSDNGFTSGEIGVPSQILAKRLLDPYLITLTKSECRSDLPPINIRFTPCAIPADVQTSWSKCFKKGMPSNAELDFLAEGCRAYGKVIKARDLILGLLKRGEQVLVVSHRIAPLELIKQFFPENICAVISSMEDTNHAAEAEAFRTGAKRIMFMGLKCAQSYSFPNCCYQIIVGCDFTYGMLHQALGRCHRLTSERPVQVQILYYPQTNEPIILNTVMAKAAQATTLLGERDIRLVHSGALSNGKITNRSITAPIGA